MGKKEKYKFQIRHDKIKLGAHTVRLLILSPLDRKTQKVPGVLWIHGGGYQAGNAHEVFFTRALSMVKKFGMVLVTPEYRLSKRHPYPAALNDCHAALLWLRDHAEELGVRTDQIMVGGESAGGGLAAAVCMMARDRGDVKIAFQLPLAMFVLERLQIFTIKVYMEKWRISIFSVACLAMLITPPDPWSMMIMLSCLIILYFGGVGLCKIFPRPKSEFDDEEFD